MTRCAIYTRVSTDDQTTENQLIILRKIAEKKGLKIVTELNDEGISGAKVRDKRTGFDSPFVHESLKPSTELPPLNTTTFQI